VGEVCSEDEFDVSEHQCFHNPQPAYAANAGFSVLAHRQCLQVFLGSAPAPHNISIAELVWSRPESVAALRPAAPQQSRLVNSQIRHRLAGRTLMSGLLAQVHQVSGICEATGGSAKAYFAGGVVGVVGAAGGGAVDVVGGVWVANQIMPSTTATATAMRIVLWSMAFPSLQRRGAAAVRNDPKI
jgi:hypothetical protein